MSFWRKRPVTVEATRWSKNGDHPLDNIADDIPAHLDEPEGKVVRRYRSPSIDGNVDCHYCQRPMHNHGWIDTPNGRRTVCPGGRIITNVRVEHNLCKPDTFEATYE